jgi:hypothetical protein
LTAFIATIDLPAGPRRPAAPASATDLLMIEIIFGRAEQIAERAMPQIAALESGLVNAS